MTTVWGKEEEKEEAILRNKIFKHKVKPSNLSLFQTSLNIP